VPQTAYFGIKNGDKATATVPELINRTFEGTVARNAQALTAGTRTLLTEVDVDNKNGELAAGLYCVIRLQLHRGGPVVRVPSQAVIFNKDGLSAAVVADGKVQFRKLELDTSARLHPKLSQLPLFITPAGPGADEAQGKATSAGALLGALVQVGFRSITISAPRTCQPLPSA
jgi:multidrug efflux pump subunit AcrA (membrane-fusion protein)